MDTWYIYMILLAVQVIAVTICVAHAISGLDSEEKPKEEVEEGEKI